MTYSSAGSVRRNEGPAGAAELLLWGDAGGLWLAVIALRAHHDPATVTPGASCTTTTPG